jgi:hypothetical protein
MSPEDQVRALVGREATREADRERLGIQRRARRAHLVLEVAVARALLGDFRRTKRTSAALSMRWVSQSSASGALSMRDHMCGIGRCSRQSGPMWRL